MKICLALRIDANTRIAFVGGGGKTTAMFRCAKQVGGKVLTAVTAHLATDEAGHADRHFIIHDPEEITRAADQLIEGVNLFTSPEVKPGRHGGLDEQAILGVKKIADDQKLPLLIEADGSRRLPAKAPDVHEPPIPEWVNKVAVVAGLSVIGRRLNENAVFRPEIFSRLSGLPLNSPIQLADLRRVMLHPSGGLKNIPLAAERIALFNQWDVYLVAAEQLIEESSSLLESYHSVLVTSLRDAEDEVKFRFENVAGIILAAGSSERFGQPKQLLEWKGRPFIEHIVRAALLAGLNPVVVVLGAVVNPIREVLREYQVDMIINEKWSEGQASSIVSGLKSVMGKCGAAVFLLSDMPQVSAEVLQNYVEYHRKTDYHILAPRIAGRPANPVMFDRRCFPALTELSGDAGGRQLYGRVPVTWLELQDPFLALDVDTPEDYSRLLEQGDDRNEG